MRDPQEAELDLLFRALPSSMVEARNALVERLRKAGDKAVAARVKALKRPAPAAWALNQVHFRAPELLERARAETERVRALHARDAVHPQELMAAHEAQREASKAVIESALQYAEEAGIPIAAAQQRRVLATLQALLTGASDEIPGRLTRELEPGGFDAIDSVGVAAPRAARVIDAAPAKQSPGSPSASASSHADSLAARAAAENQLRTCERAVREAEAIVHKRRSAQQRGLAELDQARRAAAEAEQALRTARTQVEASEAQFQAQRAALAQAESALDAARTQLAQAKRTLSAV